MQRRSLAVVPAVLVILVGAFAYQRARSLIADVREVERSHAIIESTDAILTRAVDAETGQRAFLLTGDDAFLQPFNGARQDINRWLDSLRLLVHDYPTQAERVAAIAAIIPTRFDLLDTGITLRRRGDPGAASVERLRNGKATMDRMRESIGALQSEERRMLAQRHIAERRSVSRAAITVGIAAVIALILSALVNLFFSRTVRER